jgi:hypothetical protein
MIPGRRVVVTPKGRTRQHALRRGEVDCGASYSRRVRRREANGAAQRAGELGEDREVGVKLDALKARARSANRLPLMLEPSELALDGGAALVELAPARRLALEQRAEAISLHPSARGLAVAGRAAPLLAPLRVGAREPPLAMLAAGRLVVAPPDGKRLAGGG